MQIFPSGSLPLSVTGGSFDGINFVAMLFAGATAYQIVPSDFDKTQITIVTTLWRGGKAYPINNDNLRTLGTYTTRKCNFYRFTNGMVIQPSTAAVPEVMMMGHIKFGATVTLMPGDRLTSQWTYNSSANSTNLAGGNTCFIDVLFTPALGKSRLVPMTVSEATLATQNSQNFVNASGVSRIEFLNFDMTTFVNQVISTVGLQSDKLSYSVPWYEAYADDARKWPNNIAEQFGTALGTAGTSVVRGLDQLPQCLSIYSKGKSGSLLNNCSVGLTFNAANNNAGQNYVVHTRLVAA